ncbi:MAG: two-component regulator propeller domain-containing protein, partial [Flavobacteriales bacterium]|nr:two-component regulator propeller domain-containing protein [Flavobacteriales bacterium]
MNWSRRIYQAIYVFAGYMLWVTFLPTLNAQFSALDFERLSLPEGMPELPVSGIVQDKRGYLWIGTPSGLYRYNGIVSKTFLKNASTRGIPDNRITQIEYIEDKVICLTLEGIFIHDCITEKDTSLYLSGVEGVPAYLVNTMTDVASDGQGGLILLSRAGFMHVDSVMHKKYEYIHRDSSESL